MDLKKINKLKERFNNPNELRICLLADLRKLLEEYPLYINFQSRKIALLYKPPFDIPFNKEWESFNIGIITLWLINYIFKYKRLVNSNELNQIQEISILIYHLLY